MAEQQQQQESMVVMRETSESRRRRLRPGRIVTLVIVFPLLGTIVNVVVAWRLAHDIDFTEFPELSEERVSKAIASRNLS